MKARPSLKPHQTSLVVAGFATLLGFLVPFVRQALLPIAYLNTHLHEMSHALVAEATGAQVQGIDVYANGSGVTPVVGGNLLLIASAGYVGASIFGAAMIYFGRTEKLARATLATLAVLLTCSMLLWVRGDVVGVVSGIGWIAVLGVVAVFVRGRPLMFICQFLGLQQCLNAVQSLFVLVDLSAGTELHSDASILQSVTGIPSILWALGWSALSLFLVFVTLRVAWQDRTAKP